MARRDRKPAPGEDPFVESVWRAWGWVQDNAQVVLVSVVLLVLGAAAVLYWRSYQEGVREQAAVELQDLRGRLLAAGPPPERIESELRAYVDRFGGTESADEARLLLARLYLRTERPGEAVDVLGEISQPSADTPLGYGVLNLLATAYEERGDTDRALEVLDDLAAEARYAFQRDRALGERARILASIGREEEAADIYARLSEEAASPEARSRYRVELGELRARLAAGGAEETDGDGSDVTGGGGPEPPSGEETGPGAAAPGAAADDATSSADTSVGSRSR